jgi:hypothetical protein
MVQNTLTPEAVFNRDIAQTVSWAFHVFSAYMNILKDFSSGTNSCINFKFFHKFPTLPPQSVSGLYQEILSLDFISLLNPVSIFWQILNNVYVFTKFAK